MRTVAGLVVALGLVAIGAACSTSSTAPDPCTTAGGACVPTTDTVECVTLLSATCSTGFTCCTVGDGSAGVDAYVAVSSDTGGASTPDAAADGSSAVVADAAVEGSPGDAGGDAHPEGGADAHAEASVDAHAHADAASDAAHDAISDATKGG